MSKIETKVMVSANDIDTILSALVFAYRDETPEAGLVIAHASNLAVRLEYAKEVIVCNEALGKARDEQFMAGRASERAETKWIKAKQDVENYRNEELERS